MCVSGSGLREAFAKNLQTGRGEGGWGLGDGEAPPELGREGSFRRDPSGSEILSLILRPLPPGTTIRGGGPSCWGVPEPHTLPPPLAVQSWGPLDQP